MEYIITEKKFKQCSKDLKRNLKDMGFDISLGASQNLLARTFGSKDYNTIVPKLKKYNQLTEQLEKSTTSLKELIDEQDIKDFKEIDTRHSLNQIAFSLFPSYIFAIKHMNNTSVLIFNENLYLDSQATIYLEVANTIAQCYYLISVADGKQLNFDFLKKIKQMNIQQKNQQTYLKPLSQIILNSISSVNSSNINGEPTENYIEQFETIFSEIIVFGLIYLGKEKVNEILEIVFKGLQENDLRFISNMKM